MDVCGNILEILNVFMAVKGEALLLLFVSINGCSPVVWLITGYCSWMIMQDQYFSLYVCSVPCVPQQVEAWVDCESGAVAVSWEPSAGSLFYTTVAQGSGGYASTCNSNETTCLFHNLLCSLNYSITVRGSDKTCSSAGSSAVKISTCKNLDFITIILHLC